MENKKEPLMSAEDYFFEELKEDLYSTPQFMEMYANYVTQWHLNNAKDFVADEAKTTYKKEPFIGGVWDIDKQSIHTAIDNYIEINLNK